MKKYLFLGLSCFLIGLGLFEAVLGNLSMANDSSANSAQAYIGLLNGVYFWIVALVFFIAHLWVNKKKTKEASKRKKK